MGYIILNIKLKIQHEKNRTVAFLSFKFLFERGLKKKKKECGKRHNVSIIHVHV